MQILSWGERGGQEYIETNLKRSNAQEGGGNIEAWN